MKINLIISVIDRPRWEIEAKETGHWNAFEFHNQIKLKQVSGQAILKMVYTRIRAFEINNIKNEMMQMVEHISRQMFYNDYLVNVVHTKPPRT